MDNLVKTISLTIAGAMLSLSVCSAQDSFKARMAREPELATAHYLLYPAPAEKLTPSPKGYRPFYLSHYGRHGSRWLIGPTVYSKPCGLMHSEDEAGNLTALGREVMAKLDEVVAVSAGRTDELTEKGHQQHREIAERMYRNFPEIFGKDAEVEAHATIIIRCILSMMSATNELSSLNPKLRITTDASNHDMYYMNWSDSKGQIKASPSYKDASDVRNAFVERHFHPERVLSALFKDPSGIDPEFYNQLIEIAMSLQGTPCNVDLLGLFNEQELYDRYCIMNAKWYLGSANSPANGNVSMYSQTNLLRNFIEEADKAISEVKPSADLRYGHDSAILPLVALMQIGDCGLSTDDLEALTDRWNACDITPMASNLQLVFYRSKKADVLVKILFQEKEMTLPIEAVTGPYYRWSDVKAFWNGILAKSPVK